MRLDKVFIDGFKNLKQLTADFDENRLTTVVIGQNAIAAPAQTNAATSATVVARFHSPGMLAVDRPEPRLVVSCSRGRNTPNPEMIVAAQKTPKSPKASGPMALAVTTSSR